MGKGKARQALVSPEGVVDDSASRSVGGGVRMCNRYLLSCVNSFKSIITCGPVVEVTREAPCSGLVHGMGSAHNDKT